MTQYSVSDELVMEATLAAHDATSLLPWKLMDESDRTELLREMRRAIAAIAPRLRAEGLRAGANYADGYGNGHTIAAGLRQMADALDPPPQKEEKE